MATTTKKSNVKTVVSKNVSKDSAKISPPKIKEGDVMALTFWVKVNGTWNSGQHLNVTNLDDNTKFDVHGTELVERSYSADVYDSEEKATKTEMAERLVSSWGRPFTVEYEKSDGTIRKLRGKLLEPEILMGRSTVQDLDITSGTPLRLVDHRTIQSLILNNVKYILKK